MAQKKMDKAREFLVNEYIKCLSEGQIPWLKGWESNGTGRIRNGSTTNMAQKKMDKAREFLVNEYIKCLSEGQIPWLKGWESNGTGRIRNGSTEKAYRGMNALILAYVSQVKGYSDPRWYTYKQAKDKGYQVRKGEKSAPISFPTLYLDGKSLTFDQYDALTKEEKDKVIRGRRAYSVFNAAQIDGVPELEKGVVHDIHGSDLVEDIRKGMGVGLEYMGDQPCYHPLLDKVVWNIWVINPVITRCSTK